MVLNEFHARTGFYKMFQAEGEIRSIARKYPNSYQIALFACCREVMTSKHGGGHRTPSLASQANLRKIIVKCLLHRMEKSKEASIIEGLMARKLEENS